MGQASVSLLLLSCFHLVLPFLSFWLSFVFTSRMGRAVVAGLLWSPLALAVFSASMAVSSLLQDLGVTKVGHMKRILCGIKELSRSAPAAEA